MGIKHAISTHVRRVRCGCGATVLAALAEGVTVAADPDPVDALTEIAGIFAGRHSFDLVPAAGNSELVFRSFERMRQRHHLVLLNHPCAHSVSVDDPGDAWKRKKSEPGPVTARPVRGPDVPPPF